MDSFDRFAPYVFSAFVLIVAFAATYLRLIPGDVLILLLGGTGGSAITTHILSPKGTSIP